MIDISKFQFKTEVLGHTIRVIDQEGNDIVVIGSVQNPENITLANLFAAAPRMYAALCQVTEIIIRNGISNDSANQAILAAQGRLK